MKIKAYLLVSLDPEIFEKIEKRRGFLKRSTYVNEMLRAALKEPNKVGDR